MTVTVATLDFVGSAAEVAVIETKAGVGTVGGAVYKPLEEMLPQVAPLQPVPLTLHDTAVLAFPLTVAVNCWLAPIKSFAVAGETLTDIGGSTTTVAVPDFVGSAAEVATTETCAGLGTAEGAV